MGYGFSFAEVRQNSTSSADIVSGDTTRYLTLLELWYDLFAKPDSDVVIDDLHAQNCGSPEGESTSFTTAKEDKGGSGVKFNALNTNEGINVVMEVKRHDETEYQFIKKVINIARENGARNVGFLFDRGYSCGSIISACMKTR